MSSIWRQETSCSTTSASRQSTKKGGTKEVFHKSVKSKTGLARSPTHTVRTQSNHFFASIYAFFKLELLKTKHQLNHFALKSKLYIKALQASFAELQRLSA